MTLPQMPGQARYGGTEEEQLKQELEEEEQRQQDYSKDDEDRLQADHATPQE